MSLKAHMYLLVSIVMIFFGNGHVLCSPKTQKDKALEWANKALWPYANQSLQRQLSEEQKWKESSSRDHQMAVEKAKATLLEWGRNPSFYTNKGKRYPYEIIVFTSERFTSVTFLPIGAPSTCQQVEIIMTNDSYDIVFILPGS